MRPASYQFLCLQIPGGDACYDLLPASGLAQPVEEVGQFHLTGHRAPQAEMRDVNRQDWEAQKQWGVTDSGHQAIATSSF